MTSSHLKDDLIEDILDMAQDLDKASKQTLIDKWTHAADGHEKNAEYYRKKGDRERVAEDEAMAKSYRTAAYTLLADLSG